MGAVQAQGARPTTETVAAAHAQLRARTDIQFDLPPAAPPEIPPWLRWLARALEPLAPFAGWIFWGVLILGAATILWLIVANLIRNRSQRDRVASPEAEAEAWRPEERVARALLAEADAMAAAGRFDEAARLLLHRSLEDIARNRPRLLRPALTSREIAGIAALPQRVREAFVAMAAPVERSLFGGHSLARSDWEEARAAYGAFALPGSWK
ncbi:hypothetical protein [Sphingomonas hengshuiensis]|uniref:DUF4129 domain-containing protein n=1 Tax=Sphingomonas hengshuiensis TaxID=1609977 RepID=A0A7U5BG31_9SPHN|nr:hypothetical protein [Sphingomonas hengshuiensis]AJP74606.1 hypothetical protein TS85_17475 [Sphingomonas hengshuiensis]